MPEEGKTKNSVRINKVTSEEASVCWKEFKNPNTSYFENIVSEVKISDKSTLFVPVGVIKIGNREIIAHDSHMRQTCPYSNVGMNAMQVKHRGIGPCVINVRTSTPGPRGQISKIIGGSHANSKRDVLFGLTEVSPNRKSGDLFVSGFQGSFSGFPTNLTMARNDRKQG
jgi:hypothetical protein